MSKKREPKLICKTPWLRRERRAFFAYWVIADGAAWTWFCAEELERLFPVISSATRIRLSLYDANPRSVRTWKVYFRFRGGMGCRKGFWTKWRCMMPAPANLVQQELLGGCARIDAKGSAWLEIEIGD